MAAIGNAAFGTAESPQSSTISELGLDILARHASFTFSPVLELPEFHDGIDQSSFTRAVCLLALRSVPGYGCRKCWGTCFPEYPIHSSCSGSWGPHRGIYVSKRGKGASDFMRRIFRSLASSDYDDAASHHAAAGTAKTETSIPVLRFMYRLRLPKGQEEAKSGEEDEEPERPEFAIIENEREVSIDIQNVLSECPPEGDHVAANPFRESYSLTLPGLPHPAHDLSELRVRVSKVSALLTLSQYLGLSERRPGEEETHSNLAVLIERLSGETGLEPRLGGVSSHFTRL